MADKTTLDLRLLQSSAPRDQAAHLRRVFISDPAAVSSVTSQLVSHVASDVLPSIVLSLWPTAANEPHTIVAVMRQELCINAQRSAIKHFYRHLRSEKTFTKAWEAVGGATGVAQLAAKLNVDNARMLFSLLGDTGRARGARKERQRAMEELLRLLWGNDEDSSSGDRHAAFDNRPLRHEYAKLVPACSGALRLEWEELKRQLPERYETELVTDHEFFEHHYNEQLRRKEITASEFLYKVKALVSNRPDYGMQLLERFVESETLLGASPNALLEVIIDPLGKRFLSKRRISSDITMHFWSRIIRCLKEREAFKKDFDNSGVHYRRIVVRVVKVWNHSRAQGEYTEMLATLFSLVPENVVRGYSLADFIKNVSSALRYKLLRLFLKHTAGNRFDIGEPTSLEHVELKGASFRWEVDIFFVLSADEALPLLEKVQRAEHQVGLWRTRSRGRFLYHERDEDEGELVDRHILRALLLNRNTAISPFVSTDLDAMRSEIRLQEIPRRMKMTTQGRSPENRARWGASTLLLCVAIGDLNLYAETLRWARRFNKDPLTVKEMYSRQCISRREGVDLLTALPTREMQSTITLDELTKRVQSANEILELLYETAIMAISEPSFNRRDWHNTFDLISRVVSKRLGRVNAFQDRSKSSDDALYEALWKPTSAMLEKMISNLLGPVGEKFEPVNPYAILSKFQIDKPKTLRGPTIKFLDSLAKFHDSAWAELRIRETPVMVTADEIWPRGLTIQHLHVHFGRALAYLPYAQSRIETIVFINPHKALQPINVNEEVQAAVGKFVDSWSKALHLYVRMPGPKELPRKAQRQERIKRAWEHATINLSKDRMSREEAERFWWPIFRRIDVKLSEVDIDERENQRSEPSLPDADEAMQPTEWNPDPDYDRISQPKKNKSLAPTYLDVMINQPNNEATFKRTKHSVFGNVNAVVTGKPHPPSFWDSLPSVKGKITGASADAYAIAGILALNMQYGSDISLLKTPVPDADAVRIPAVYLDQEFLEREVNKNSNIVSMLSTLGTYVPAGLLVGLATSILESIRKKPETEKPYRVFAEIIKIILVGTKPSLAVPLVQQFVLENPDASAWHRLLLNPRSLINLLPSDAKSFFESFTDAILNKLQEQAITSTKEPDSSKSKVPKAPLVKVTTVKMLAQLLRESPVVNPSLAVDLNTSILKRATHVDIRTASVKGLTEAIASTNHLAIKLRILDVLLKHAAPIASSVNEAQPATDWKALSADDELPEVRGDEYGSFMIPPILDLLLHAGSEIKWKSDEGQALKELKYSVLDASAENNRRWTSLFLKKHGFSVPGDAQLPAIPVFPETLNTLLTMMRSEMSLKYIDLTKQYILLNMNPPEWLSSITKAVKSNQKLSRSNSGKYWIHLWDTDNLQFMAKIVSTISRCLRPKNKTKRDDADAQSRAFYQALEQFLFETADAIITRANAPEFPSFLANTSTVDREIPVWSRILDRINSLRTPAWQADLNRKPAVLPDTLPLKIRMLNLPYRSSTDPDKAKATLARCTDGVIRLLEEMVSSGGPYFHGFSTLREELVKIEPMAEMAILIGNAQALHNPNAVTLLDHLRVELAVGLLERSNIFKDGFGKAHDEIVVKDAKLLAMKMSDSSVENFRILSAPLKADVDNDTGFGWWS